MGKICCRERPMVFRWFWTVFLIFLNINLFNGFSVDKYFEFILMEMLGGSPSAYPTDKSAIQQDLLRKGIWFLAESAFWMVRQVVLVTKLTAMIIQIRLMPLLKLTHPWITAGRRRIAAINYSITILYLLWSLIICKHWLKTSLIYNVAEHTRQYLWQEFLQQAMELFAVLPHYPSLFDSTKGYPGKVNMISIYGIVNTLYYIQY